MDRPQKALDLLKKEGERWRVSLFGERLHVITEAPWTSPSPTLPQSSPPAAESNEFPRGRFRSKTSSSVALEKARAGRQSRGGGINHDERILAQTRKELIQFVRDKRALGLALILPVMQLILMGSRFRSRSKTSGRGAGPRRFTGFAHLSSTLSGSPVTFHIIPFSGDRKPETRLLEPGPRRSDHSARFGRDIVRGVSTPVQMLIDASDANTANCRRLRQPNHLRMERRINGAAVQAAPVTAAIRFWYNPGRSSKKFYGPGHLRSRAVALSAAPRHARDGQGRRTEDHFAGLRLQYLGA